MRKRRWTQEDEEEQRRDTEDAKGCFGCLGLEWAGCLIPCFLLFGFTGWWF